MFPERQHIEQKIKTKRAGRFFSCRGIWNVINYLALMYPKFEW